MTVRELLEELGDADPDAEVRFMAVGADDTESDSVDEVEFQHEPWTFETGIGYSVCYAGEPEPRGEDHENVEYRRLPVVLLKPWIPLAWRAKVNVLMPARRADCQAAAAQRSVFPVRSVHSLPEQDPGGRSPSPGQHRFSLSGLHPKAFP